MPCFGGDIIICAAALAVCSEGSWGPVRADPTPARQETDSGMKSTGLDELGHSVQGKSLRLPSLQQSWEQCPQPTRCLPLLAGCPRPHVTALTFVVVPDPHFAEVSQAQHVGEAEFVHLVPLELVGLVGLLQGKDPTVPVLPK